MAQFFLPTKTSIYFFPGFLPALSIVRCNLVFSLFQLCTTNNQYSCVFSTFYWNRTRKRGGTHSLTLFLSSSRVIHAVRAHFESTQSVTLKEIIKISKILATLLWLEPVSVKISKSNKNLDTNTQDAKSERKCMALSDTVG